jgi:hypothetical protein
MPETAVLAGLRASRPEAIGEAADPRRRPRPPLDDQDASFASWQHALAAPGVIGLVAGRSLLYPPDGDVAGAVDTAASLLEGVPACT